MPSTKVTTTHVMTGGFNQEAASHASNPNNFWDMLNMRPVNGAYVQTPLFISKIALTALTGESASPVRHLGLVMNQNDQLRYFVLCEANARYVDPVTPATQVLIPFVLQTAVPANSSEYGQALLTYINTTDFAADNDYIVVEIVTATTVRYNRNGGAWSSAVTIANEVILNVTTRLTVNFTPVDLDAFTPGDQWIWTRRATPYQGIYPTYGMQQAVYRKDLYLAGYDRHILRVRDGFATSVGYKRIYGKYVAVFYNHLVVAQFAEATYDAVFGQVDSYSAPTTPWQLAWSDLNNPDNFHSTLSNEADSFIVPANASFDNTQPGITGMAGNQNQLYIYLSDEMYVMNYTGLPNVMQVECMNFGIGAYYQNSVIACPRGHYFISRDNVCYFNGATVSKIGYNVQAKLFGEIAPPSDPYAQKLYGFWDADKAEVIWTYYQKLASGVYQARQLIYQVDYNRFYFRNSLSNSSTGEGDSRAIGKVYQGFQRLLYGGNQKLYIDSLTGVEDVANSVPDAVDAAGVQTYTQPRLETNDDFCNDLFHIKEPDTIFIDASYESSTGIEVGFSARLFSAAAKTMTALATLWSSTIVNGLLSLPRTSGRVFSYRFTFKGTKPYGARLNAWQDFYYGKGRDIEN